jgi:hypothetical protein
MTSPWLFLETTIQIERVVGSRARQAALRAELANYRLVTSHYVLGEFLRTVVKDAVHLHRLVCEQVHLDDVMTAIAQHPNKREASRMTLLLGSLLRTGYSLEPTIGARDELLDRLARMIDITLLNRFHGGIELLVDDVQCGLARERPNAWDTPTVLSYQLRSQCVRTVRECALAEKMATWRPQLEKVADGLCNATDPALARIAQLAGQILEDPILARGRNCTWYLGDLVIALELPPDTPLYTTNRRHYEPILVLLGKQLHTPVAER